MAKNTNKIVGSWAFLIGFILAVIFGIFGVSSPMWITAMVVIGFVIGLLNISNRDSTPLLVSGIAIIVASAFGQVVVGSVPYLGGILLASIAIYVPATIIVALRNVFDM